MSQPQAASFSTFIRTTAQSLGIEHMDPALLAALGPDIEYRLREIIQEAIKFMKHSKRSMLCPRDVTHALQLRNVETLYGYSAQAGPRKYVRAPTAPGLFFAADDVVDFNQLLQEPELPVPLDVTFSVHWLAIEGVQPAIPLNPSLRKKEKQAQLRKKKAALPLAKPAVAHVLSAELQRYYEEVTRAVLGSDARAADSALASVASDPGLNDLLPYLSQFVAEQVTRCLRELPVLMQLMRLVQALLRSEHLHLEPYLHQLMPCILTCLVGKQLCADPATQDHWALRDLAAQLVRTVCENFGGAYQTLQPRITKTLVAAFLDASKPLTTHYGAVRGLAGLGQAVMQTLVLPHVPQFLAGLRAAKSEGSALRRQEAARVYAALLSECADYVKSAAHAQALLNDAAAAAVAAAAADDDGGGATGKRARTAVAVPAVSHSPSYDSMRRALLPDVPKFVAMLRELFGADFDKLVENVKMSVFAPGSQ